MSTFSNLNNEKLLALQEEKRQSIIDLETGKPTETAEGAAAREAKRQKDLHEIMFIEIELIDRELVVADEELAASHDYLAKGALQSEKSKAYFDIQDAKAKEQQKEIEKALFGS